MFGIGGAAGWTGAYQGAINTKSNSMNGWAAAAQAATQIGGQMIANSANRKGQNRQFKYQQQLMDMQHKNQRELNQQGSDLQYELWNKTNAEAQIKHLEKAGLNVGMMYGGSGAGGATTGSQGGGSAAGGSAQAAPQMSMDLGATSQMLAQIKLMNAQAKKAEAEAESIRGVEGTKGATEIAEGKTRIESLTQGINNQKAVEELTKAETELKEIEGMVAEGTIQNRMNEIIAKSEQAMEYATIASFQKDVDQATIDSKIDIIKSTAIGAALNNTLAKMNIKLTGEQTRAIGAKIYDTYRQIDLEKFSNETERMNAETNALRQAVEEYLGEENLTMRQWEFTSKSLEGVIGKFKPRKTSTTWTKNDSKGTSTGHTETKTK